MKLFISLWQYGLNIIKLHKFTYIKFSCRTNICIVKWEKTFFNLNSGGILGPQNGKSKYCSNDKTNSRFVISMTENTLVTIFMSCVDILTKPITNLDFLVEKSWFLTPQKPWGSPKKKKKIVKKVTNTCILF